MKADCRRPMPSIAQAPAVERNDFDRNEGWITFVITLVFVICGIASGYATFLGINLFLSDTGGVSLLVNGTSVILTIAVVAILTVGWTLICRWGPEARSGFLKGLMVLLGAALFAITISVSSLSNLLALVGPAAKVRDWQRIHTENTIAVNEHADRSLGVLQLLPGWRAENERACLLAEREIDGGLVSTVGAGVGPVAVALVSVCQQTGSFIASMETAVAETRLGVDDARTALRSIRTAIRDRARPVADREDGLLDAGDALNEAVQRIRAADLSDVLDAGAVQVSESIAELQPGSSFTRQQVEMVAALRDGLNGLVGGTRAVSARLRAGSIPEFRPVASLDYMSAIFAYWPRFHSGVRRRHRHRLLPGLVARFPAGQQVRKAAAGALSISPVNVPRCGDDRDALKTTTKIWNTSMLKFPGRTTGAAFLATGILLTFTIAVVLILIHLFGQQAVIEELSCRVGLSEDCLRDELAAERARLEDLSRQVRDLEALRERIERIDVAADSFSIFYRGSSMAAHRHDRPRVCLADRPWHLHPWLVLHRPAGAGGNCAKTVHRPRERRPEDYARPDHRSSPVGFGPDTAPTSRRPLTDAGGRTAWHERAASGAA